ncbi:hypothetical protein HN937_12065 [Candidatus Poribacteria bacterium]|jgi:hypothetical protein|nr:hypothetical protein [Candidatus Poribacteria bacterium]
MPAQTLPGGFTLCAGRGKRLLLAPDGRTPLGTFKSYADAHVVCVDAMNGRGRCRDHRDLRWWVADRFPGREAPEVPEVEASPAAEDAPPDTVE